MDYKELDNKYAALIQCLQDDQSMQEEIDRLEKDICASKKEFFDRICIEGNNSIKNFIDELQTICEKTNSDYNLYISTLAEYSQPVKKINRKVGDIPENILNDIVQTSKEMLTPRNLLDYYSVIEEDIKQIKGLTDKGLRDIFDEIKSEMSSFKDYNNKKIQEIISLSPQDHNKEIERMKDLMGDT
jgi:hypothetical protein